MVSTRASRIAWLVGCHVLGAVAAARGEESPRPALAIRIAPLERILPTARQVCERLDACQWFRAGAVKTWNRIVGERGERLEGVDLTRPLAGYRSGTFLTLAVPVRSERDFLDGLRPYGFEGEWRGPEAVYVWAVPNYNATAIAFRDGYAHLSPAREKSPDWPDPVEPVLSTADSKKLLSATYSPHDLAAAPNAKDSSWLSGLVQSALKSQLAQIREFRFEFDVDAQGQAIAEGRIEARGGSALSRTYEKDGQPTPAFVPAALPGRNAFTMSCRQDETALNGFLKLLPLAEPSIGKKNLARFEKLFARYGGTGPRALLIQGHSSGGFRSLLVCLQVADGATMDAELQRIYVQGTEEEPPLRFNVAQSAQGRWIHALDCRLADGTGALPATVYFATRHDAVMLALGQESLDVLRRAIDVPRSNQMALISADVSLVALADWHRGDLSEPAREEMRRMQSALFEKDQLDRIRITYAGGWSLSVRAEAAISTLVFWTRYAKVVEATWKEYARIADGKPVK